MLGWWVSRMRISHDVVLNKKLRTVHHTPNYVQSKEHARSVKVLCPVHSWPPPCPDLLPMLNAWGNKEAYHTTAYPREQTQCPFRRFQYAVPMPAGVAQ